MKKRFLQLLLTGLFALICLNSFAQINVSGTVTSDDGELLPGVSIVVKGTANGVVTNFEGNYTFNGVPSDAILVYSFVGMQTQEVAVDGRSKIDVVLETSSIGMDEVVVTALGISREKKSLGYSVAEVEGESLQNVAQENVLNALSGKVAGVQINSVGGAGSSVSMVIRGASSLTSDNQPLFVIDGVPMNNTLNNVTEMAKDTKADYGNAISDINPEDIESMSVLKGPSAAALYGSRAGNGVVLITTKSGKKSSGLGVSVTSNTVIENPYKYLDKHTLFANGKRPYTQATIPGGIEHTDGNTYYVVPGGDSYWVGPELDKGMLAYQWPFFDAEGNLRDPRPMVSHPDNYKEFFNPGVTTTNGVSITNATDKINYRLSYNNMQHRGMIPNSDLHRNTLSLNSSVKLTNDITVSSNLNFTTSGADNRPMTGNRGANPLQYLYDMNSHIDIDDLKDYWEPGLEGLQQRAPYNLKQNSDGTFEKEDMMNNPYFIANEVNNSFMRNKVYGNAKIDWKINKEFSLMVRHAMDQLNETRETKIAPSYSKEPGGFYGIQNIFSREQNTDFLLAFNKNISDFSINASIGGNYMYKISKNNLTSAKNGGSGLIVPNVYTLDNITSDNIVYNSGLYEKAIYSLYALASFGYKDAVYLDLTARNDWSSTLPEVNRSYFYPSASLSVLLNNTFDLGDNISLAKIRGGWAQVGNDTDPYKLAAVLGKNPQWGSIPRASAPSSILLPDMKPEIQTSYEFGADLNLYDNRIRLEGTYYHNENKNQILSVGLPPSSGKSSYQINAGLISSRGLELGAGFTPVSRNDLKWDVNFVWSKNRTKIEELAEGFNYIELWSDAKGGAYTWVGEEIGQIIDRALVRVEDPNSEYYGWPLLDEDGWDNSNSDKWDSDGNRVAPVIGNFNPDFILGMQTSLSYKDWTLSASLDWRVGGQFVSQTFRYGESDLQTNRWLDKVHDLSGIDNIPAYLKEHADEFLSPDGEFFVLVGGPTAGLGGLEHTEDGVTLFDGVFMPGVYMDEDGNYVENLGGPGTKTIRYQDYYGWSYTRNATFDADFIKLREISIAYNVGAIKSLGVKNASVSLYSRNLILWTKAGIGVDPETAFQAEGGVQGSGIQFKQGIERYNVTPWTIPVGVKLNVSF